jgi:hypothetical protein
MIRFEIFYYGLPNGATYSMVGNDYLELGEIKKISLLKSTKKTEIKLKYQDAKSFYKFRKTLEEIATRIGAKFTSRKKNTYSIFLEPNFPINILSSTIKNI